MRSIPWIFWNLFYSSLQLQFHLQTDSYQFHYNIHPSIQNYKLVSHTTFFVCINFYTWVAGHTLQSRLWTTDFWETFQGNFIHYQSFWQLVIKTNFSIISRSESILNYGSINGMRSLATEVSPDWTYGLCMWLRFCSPTFNFDYFTLNFLKEKKNKLLFSLF